MPSAISLGQKRFDSKIESTLNPPESFSWKNSFNFCTLCKIWLKHKFPAQYNNISYQNNKSGFIADRKDYMKT